MKLDIRKAREKRLGIDSGIPESRVVRSQAPEPAGHKTELITGFQYPAIVEIRWISGEPQRTKVSRHAGCKAKFSQKGRTDPAANFQNLKISAPTEIDCHKSKISRTPTRAQIRETEPDDIRQLLDDWEARTGKTAPSRRIP